MEESQNICNSFKYRRLSKTHLWERTGLQLQQVTVNQPAGKPAAGHLSDQGPTAEEERRETDLMKTVTGELQTAHSRAPAATER